MIACDQENWGSANVLNSGNEAIYETNMRGQQRNDGETGELAYI